MTDTLSTKRSIGRTLGPFKGITKFLEEAVTGLKDVPFAKSLAAASPWLEAAGDTLASALPPVKFALSLFEKLTAVPDPNELAELAFTLSYEHALAQAVVAVGEPKLPFGEATEVTKRLRDVGDVIPESALDFSRISYDDLLGHPFITWADDLLDEVLRDIGYSEVQRREFLNEIHPRFVTHFKTLISHGDSREKFAPLRDRLAAGTGERSATAALLEHAQYQRALFEEHPVFGKEVFALRHVYIDTECGVLDWGAIRDTNDTAKRGIDPFSEKHGGRHRLGDTILSLLADPQFNDAIVIQGVAGAGKSAFTQWLAAELIRSGLRPIRVLLRDVRLERQRPILEALSDAIRYDDESRRNTSGYPRPDDAFNGGAIFRERIRLGDAVICPYVIILDGWDEISISVSEGFKVRLDRMLEQIRTEFLSRRDVPVRVILTGRPSADVASSPFLRKATPILTLRPLNPDDLQKFIGNLSSCIAEPRLPTAPGTGWPKFETEKLAPVVKQYRDEFARMAAETSPQESRKMEVFGLPLLALLAVRLLSEPGAKPGEIIATPTVLYRNLVDLTCGAGGKFVDSDEPVEQHEQFRLIGGRLRDLLRRTAAALTLLGRENISYLELRLRLQEAIEDLVKTVERVTGDNVLSQLMISYFFKGGHEELGCEFLHKSFREYLFAEGIVETLKQYGRQGRAAAPERAPYWKDFDVADARHQLLRALGVQLAPQWLTPEVVSNLEELIEWEIGRAAGETDFALPKSQPTAPLDLSQWKAIRDGLADLWDWWAEGVHMRPQVSLSARLDAEFERTYAQKLVETSIPIDVPKGTIPEPPRTVGTDAHLGDALFRLNVWSHFFCARADGWLDSANTAAELWSGVSEVGKGPRRYQSSVTGSTTWVLFAPSGSSPQYWPNYVSRINAAGWRWPYGNFPLGCNMSAVDLRKVTFGPDHGGRSCDWSYANLSDGNGEFGTYQEHIFRLTLLTRTHLSFSFLLKAKFSECDLSHAAFLCTSAHSAIFERCSFIAGRFDGTDFRYATLSECDFTGAQFDHARLNDATLTRCDFETTSFRNATNLVGTTLHGISGTPKLHDVVLIGEPDQQVLPFDPARIIRVPT